MKVSFKLRSPLKFAYVRVDGGSAIAIEPTARRELTVGTHTIQWKPNEDQPWVQGRTITLVPGGKSTIRVSKTGVQLE